MATDDLMDDPGTSVSNDDKKTQNTSTADDIKSAIKEGLSSFGSDLRTHAANINQYVQQAVQGAQTAVDAGKATQSQNDLTQELLTDPDTAINKIIQKWAAENLGPYFATKVQDDYEDLVDTHRTRMDKEYGEGKFDELILPELEAVVDKTHNKSAKSSKQYVATVIRGIVGHENVLPKLMEARGVKVEADKKALEDGPTGMLDGGRRRGAKPALSPEDQSFLAHYEETTDKKVDRKLMEEALAVRRRDGAWTIDSFPGLTAK